MGKSLVSCFFETQCTVVYRFELVLPASEWLASRRTSRRRVEWRSCEVEEWSRARIRSPVRLARNTTHLAHLYIGTRTHTRTHTHTALAMYASYTSETHLKLYHPWHTFPHVTGHLPSDIYPLAPAPCLVLSEGVGLSPYDPNRGLSEQMSGVCWHGCFLSHILHCIV